MRPDFDKAQDAATKLLLQQNISSLSIDVKTFILPGNIFIDSMQNFCKLSGLSINELPKERIDGACVLRDRGIVIILYDETIGNEQRKHWGIVHELGHVMLDHTKDDQKEEIEAHFFAAQIVMPEIVLWTIAKRCGSLSSYEIYNHFNVSLEAASKRIKTLKRRNCYNYSKIDQDLLEKFNPLIESNFSSRFAS